MKHRHVRTSHVRYAAIEMYGDRKSPQNLTNAAGLHPAVCQKSILNVLTQTDEKGVRGRSPPKKNPPLGAVSGCFPQKMAFLTS